MTTADEMARKRRVTVHKRWSMAIAVTSVCAGVLGTAQRPAAAADEPAALQFERCELRDHDGVPWVEAQCAQLMVDENRADPDSRQIGLRVVRVEARVEGRHADPILLLAGGPGQSAVDAYLQLRGALHRLNRDRDIILVDQRGTGGSNRLACPVLDLEEETSLSADQWRALAVDCLRVVERKADPRFYTTSDYIDDLQTVRTALGVDVFNLIGGSYGTRVALEYLRRHPEAIRSVVLDGVVPPELPLLRDHARNLDDALERSFAACSATPECTERYGDIGRRLTQLRERLAEAPSTDGFHDAVDFSPQTGRLTRDALAIVVRLFSYAPETAALLPLLISEAQLDRASPVLATLDALGEDLQEQLAHGMELSVICTEDAPFLNPRPEDRDTLLGTMLVTGTLEQCAVWPKGRLPDDFKRPVESDTPVLILSGEFDPVTPPRYGDEVAQGLSNSRHLLAPGQGHIVLARGCMPRLVREFIEDPDPAALDAQCLEDLGAMPAFLDYNGFAP